MTAQTKTVLKSYFETGDRPTEQQFADLVDSIPGEAGVLTDADIPAAIARDAEVAAAVSTHAAANDPHGDRAYADAAAAARKTLSDYRNVVVVDAGGNGDYTTLAAALAAITDDDASHVYNVFVFGEAVDAALLSTRPYINVHGSDLDTHLKQWTESGAYEMTAITYNGTYPTVISSATVKWPDGSAGVLTVTAQDTTHLVETAYTITHTASGKTVTQAAVTLNANGDITVKPALTVA